VKAYPALVDEDSVAIQLVESPVVQQQLMWAGQRRLVLLNVPSPIKYLQEKLPNKAKLGLYFNPFGKVAELIDDCIACGCDKLIEQHGGMAWDEAGFEALKEYVRAELNDAVVEVAKQVEAVLTLSHEIKKRLKGKMQLDTAFAMSDIQQQLGNLIHKGFVTETGWQRLPDLLRYLRAIERRLEKLAIDPNRDRVYMLKVHSVESEYKALLAKIPKSQLIPAEVANIRWMIEELRVSSSPSNWGRHTLSRINGCRAPLPSAKLLSICFLSHSVKATRRQREGGRHMLGIWLGVALVNISGYQPIAEQTWVQLNPEFYPVQRPVPPIFAAWRGNQFPPLNRERRTAAGRSSFLPGWCPLRSVRRGGPALQGLPGQAKAHR
jgi:hypothetical protein